MLEVVDVEEGAIVRGQAELVLAFHLQEDVGVEVGGVVVHEAAVQAGPRVIHVVVGEVNAAHRLAQLRGVLVEEIEVGHTTFGDTVPVAADHALRHHVALRARLEGEGGRDGAVGVGGRHGVLVAGALLRGQTTADRTRRGVDRHALGQGGSNRELGNCTITVDGDGLHVNLGVQGHIVETVAAERGLGEHYA